MKKALLAVAVLGFAAAAFAHGEPGAEPNGMNGGVSIITNGSSVAGSYVSGAGTSYEHADSRAGGSSELTSHSWDGGAKVSTETNTYATTNASGTVTGEGTEQGIVTGDKGSTIYNGAIGFGSTQVTAGGSIMFGSGAVQPVGSIPAAD
jgi:hypothetical protein